MAKAPNPEPTVVYLLCFDIPLSHARHYIGSSHDLVQRMAQHRGEKSGGARIMRALAARGGTFALARTWWAGKHFQAGGGHYLEAKLKNLRQPRWLCPRCRPAYLQEVAARMKVSRRLARISPA